MKPLSSSPTTFEVGLICNWAKPSLSCAWAFAQHTFLALVPRLNAEHTLTVTSRTILLYLSLRMTGRMVVCSWKYRLRKRKRARKRKQESEGNKRSREGAGRESSVIHVLIRQCRRRRSGPRVPPRIRRQKDGSAAGTRPLQTRWEGAITLAAAALNPGMPTQLKQLCAWPGRRDLISGRTRD